MVGQTYSLFEVNDGNMDNTFSPPHPCRGTSASVSVWMHPMVMCSMLGESVWPRPVPQPLLTLLLHVAEGVWAQQTVQQYWHCRVDWRLTGQPKPVAQLQRKYTPTPPVPSHPTTYLSTPLPFFFCYVFFLLSWTEVFVSVRLCACFMCLQTILKIVFFFPACDFKLMLGWCNLVSTGWKLFPKWM